jgi:group I intron endonuclease
MTQGVYAIRTSDGKIYVGSSVDIESRMNGHDCGRRSPARLQEAMAGLDARPEILEIVEDGADLSKREQYWIDHFDATNPEKGYNSFAASTRARPQKTRRDTLKNMKTLLTPIDATTHKRLKLLAVERETTMEDTIRAAIAEYLSRHESR